MARAAVAAAGGRFRLVTSSSQAAKAVLLGRPVEASYQVTALEPDRGFEGTMTSPMFGFSEQIPLEPDQAGTRVSMKAAVEPHGVFRFLSPIMPLASAARSGPTTTASRP